MAKIEKTRMTVSLDNDSKRIIRDLTKAIDRLTRNVRPYEVRGTVRRLAEPAGELDPGEAQLREPQLVETPPESPQEAINRLYR